MRKAFLLAALALLVASTPKACPAGSLPLPSAGTWLFGVFPGNLTGSESGVSQKDYQDFAEAVGKGCAWIYFSHEWGETAVFPSQTVGWILREGSIPWIRLMLRSDTDPATPERTFTLLRILAGEFDETLRRWARDAKACGKPLLVEYGTEMNGEWFSWNGRWNGADNQKPDGAERFRDAYRHIIELCRSEGADNLVWVFHVNAEDIPGTPWNRLEAYYPGDPWIDWLAISAYGAQTPMDDEASSFRELVDRVLPRLRALAPGKPVVIAEFGCTSGNARFPQCLWAQAALRDLLSGRWPDIRGFCWWNEGWQNDDDPAHDTNMRVQDNPELREVFRRLVGNNPKVKPNP